ncbi:MAG: hypothetical protein ACRD2C_01690 [Acidimicrobiales bacterium]
MRGGRQLALVGLVVAGALAVDEMGDLFQSRGDRVEPGSRSEVVLEVEEQRYKPPLDQGAQALVMACAGSVYNRLVGDPAVVEIEPGRYRFTVEPSLGRYNEVKLVGCLEDLTIDRLRADVVSVETVA